MTNQVIGQDCGALKTGIRPSRWVRVSHIESRNSHGEDLVGGLWDRSLDSFFVGITENGRHDEPLVAQRDSHRNNETMHRSVT